MNKTMCWIIGAFALASLASCENTDPKDSPYDNRIYITESKPVSMILLKGENVKDQSRVLTVGSAKKLTHDVTITYKVDPQAVENYNREYSEKAVLLNEKHYKLVNSEVVIPAQSVTSTPFKIEFKNLNDLNRDILYALPVTLSEVRGEEVLESARTHYYIFKGASMINVVPDLSESYISFVLKNPEVLNGLTHFTMEGLLRPHEFKRMISTFMGVEGVFLLRFGDAGKPANQLQVATNSSDNNINYASPDLPVNTWTHIAVTFENGVVKTYFNGVKWLENSKLVGRLGSINLGVSDFFIGRSYDNNRQFSGEMSELRIWNVVRSAQDIKDNMYGVEPDTPGLVAYWKLDDGAGIFIKDYAKGNHGNAKIPVKWIPVSLPVLNDK